MTDTTRLIDETPVNARQIVAARKLLGMNQDSIAKLADCGRSTLADFERGARKTDYFVLCRIKYVLEALGVEFLNMEDGSYGVRLKTTGEGVMLKGNVA